MTKQPAKTTNKKQKKSEYFEPTRLALAVAALAAVTLLLLAIIAMV
ncbi:MAG TPA: hypothetical protein VK502_03300 [Candidatus Saccharimonadales bacterium]|jgi:hypothetical protein|nr:hypothetical protein [Candidatus Saccharimonadales bacterium]